MLGNYSLDYCPHWSIHFASHHILQPNLNNHSEKSANKKIHIGFFLLPQFSLVSLSGALDALMRANETIASLARLIGNTNGIANGVTNSNTNGIAMVYPTFALSLLSFNGEPVASGSGAEVVVQGSLNPVARLHSDIPSSVVNIAPNAFEHFDALFIVSDAPLPQQGHASLIGALQAFAMPKKTIGGIGTGAYLLARAQLLDNYRATIHWPYASLLAEDYPDTVVSTNLFEIDRDRLTCASGGASFDMMLSWIAQRLPNEISEEVVAELVDHFGVERQRTSKEHQRVPLSARIGGGQPKLTEAVSLMEANFEEPLPTEEIARLVGVSRRQLERLFKQYLNSLPSRYYLELRLTRARQLLQQTSQSILQIGLSCGFSSGPHFSSAYRNHFGITPREQRTQRLAAGNNVMTGAK